MMKKMIIFAFAATVALFMLFSACSNRAARIPQESLESLLRDEQADPVMTEETTTAQPEAISTTEVTETPTEAEAINFDNIHFDYDKYELTTTAREILAGHAGKLKANGSTMMLIEGHCDDRGTIEYNLSLGERRAVAVKTYLVNFGIDPDRLYTITYGKERPVDSRQNEAAWARNRRAAFQIVEN